MAVCCKCKHQFKFYETKYQHNGKIYCSECYNKQLAKEKKLKRKKKNEQDAKKTVLKAYKKDSLKLIKHFITQWKPEKFSREIQYTSSLKKYLDAELSHDDIYVGKEPGIDSSRLDLVTGIDKPYRDVAI